MKLQAGTTGHGYAAWTGTFYPERVAAANMLAHYAARLPAVDIHNTFYRLPRATALAVWTEAVCFLKFFKHEEAGAGPDLARRFLDLAAGRPGLRPQAGG